MSTFWTRRMVSGAIASLVGTGAYSQETNNEESGWNPDLNNPELGFDTPQSEEDRLNDEDGRVTRNIGAFVGRSDWKDYFNNLKNGAILVDTKSRALYFWSQDESLFKIYPVAVPNSDELTRLGRTSVVQKRVGPSWRPTPSMLKRNPSWPKYIPPGPGNPLGTHALYLSWQYYRIHGTHDNRKIGRRSSNGCIGLYNAQIEELFGYTKIGTQVLLI